MARTQNVKEGRCADACHEDEDIDLSVDQSGAEAQRNGVVLDGNFSKGRSHGRSAAITYDQPGHLCCHTAFERGYRHSSKTLVLCHGRERKTKI